MPRWEEEALCKGTDDPELFFEGGEAERIAKAQCSDCPVTNQCLTLVLSFESKSRRHGVWGGLTERERSAIYGGSAIEDQEV